MGNFSYLCDTANAVSRMKTLEQYILEIDSKRAGIFGFLRELVLSCSPFITEELTFGKPHYYYHGRLCYINTHANGVDLCFCNGSDINDPFDMLKSKEHANIKSITFDSVKDVEYDKIQSLLVQALLLNELKSGRKHPVPVY